MVGGDAIDTQHAQGRGQGQVDLVDAAIDGGSSTIA